MEVEGRLSQGAVAAIAEGALAAGVLPRLQVFRLSGMKRGSARYVTVLSDGAHSIGAILPASVDHLVRDGRIRPGAVVRLLEFTLVTEGRYRAIEVKQLEVMQTDCKMMGNPNDYRFGHLQNKRVKLDVDSVPGPAELNCGGYSGGLGLNWHPTRGVVAVLQRPVMQVVGVSQLTLKLKESENYCHLILSDGVYTLNALLALFPNHLIKDTHLNKGTIVRLLTFSYFTIKSLSMIRIGKLEVLQTECELIGSPKAYELRCIEKLDGLKTKCGEPYSESVSKYAQPNNVSYSSCPELKWYLTHGAVAAIMKGEMAVEQQPVMQVVDFSLMSQNGFSFYRILLSDGVHQVYVNLFPHLSHLVVGNYLQKGTRVRFLKFIRDTFKQDKNYRITIAADLEVLDKECELIGSPTFYELGNKEKELDAGHAASVSLDDLAQQVGGSGIHLAGQGLKCHLTTGIVAVLQQPVMQVVVVYSTRSEFKKYGRYSLLLSDGVHAHDVVLVSELNHLVKNIHLRGGTIIRLLYVFCSYVESPRTVVADLEVLQTECEIIGSPEAYELCSMEKPHVLECKCEPYPGSGASYAKPLDVRHLNRQRFKGHLTTGAVAAMVEGEITVEQQPVMQVVSISRPCYTIALSDGVHKTHSCLSPHLTHLVKDNRLRDGTIVRVLKIVYDYGYFITTELEVLQTEHELIGRPPVYVMREARNKQNERADHAAYVPEGDAAQPTGGSHPRYKATPG